MTALWTEKKGNGQEEYEDVAAFDEAPRDAQVRAIVCDGATEAYDSQKWVAMLASSFLHQWPPMDARGLQAWLQSQQESWRTRAPTEFVSVFDEEKFRGGSYATLLALMLDQHDGRSVCWTAAAVGDTVLFQIRQGQVVTSWPKMRAHDFGVAPDLIHTDPRQLDTAMERIRIRSGVAEAGDTLLVTTDALAHWATWRAENGVPVWDYLTRLEQRSFRKLVDEVRAVGEMHNDDVTLLIVRIDPVIGSEEHP